MGFWNIESGHETEWSSGRWNRQYTSNPFVSVREPADQKVSARAWDWIRSFVFIAVYTLTYGSRPHHQNSGVLGGVEYVN